MVLPVWVGTVGSWQAGWLWAQTPFWVPYLMDCSRTEAPLPSMRMGPKLPLLGLLESYLMVVGLPL